MSHVTRYKLGLYDTNGAERAAHKEGDFVSYSDYKTLEAQLKAYQEAPTWQPSSWPTGVIQVNDCGILDVTQEQLADCPTVNEIKVSALKEAIYFADHETMPTENIVTYKGFLNRYAEILGALDTKGSSANIRFSGDLMYIGGEEDKAYVVNLSDPENPTFDPVIPGVSE